MIRAGVFIGVDKTGGLHKLNDAAAGATRMYNWALSQGIAADTHAKLITDERGQRVHTDRIYDAVSELLAGAGVHQLIVYFAGHGVNINRNEHWLLTDAPVRASAAVDVTGSVELARYCGIQHVIVISDACRVAAEGIQAQSVRGIDIFPNEPVAEKSKPVDQLFACSLGRTAAEIKDPAAAAGTYSALYTGALLDALKGLRSELLEAEPDDAARYVRLRPLQRYLEHEVPFRLRALNLHLRANQNPDALITSESSWLSRVVAKPGGGQRRLRGQRPNHAPLPESGRSGPTLRSTADELVRSAIAGGAVLGRGLEDAVQSLGPGARELVAGAHRLAARFGPEHLDPHWGIMLRGASIVESFSAGARTEPSAGGALLRIERVAGAFSTVLLRLSNTKACLVPVLRGFITALSLEDDELIDVAYEPSPATAAKSWVANQPAELRALRPLAASLFRHGQFRLDRGSADALLEKISRAEFIDPSLAVYIAYACHDIQALDLVRELSLLLQRKLGLRLFDLELLGRQLFGVKLSAEDRLVTPIPLISNGYALLRANRVRLADMLTGIDRTLESSPWSLFSLRAFTQLKDILEKDAAR